MNKTLSGNTNKIFEELIGNEKIRKYLEKIKDYHLETFRHSIRVCIYSIDIGLNFKYDRKHILSLGTGALLHDIGKIKIPLEILDKKDYLTEEEMKIIKKHPRLGYDELKDSENEIIKKIVIGHHECKVMPYPRDFNLKLNLNNGEEKRITDDKLILELTQIVAIADIYDALATKRSYKNKIETDKIKEIICEDYKGDKKYLNYVIECMV